MAFLQSIKKKDQDMNFNFKDTFRLIEDRNKTESPVSGSLHSSTSEMSKLENRQLQRSFQAIQRPETPPSPKEEESEGHFNLTFRDTITDADRDITTPKVYNRQSSVDSEEDERFQRARSSGMFKSSVTGSRESVLSVGSTDSKFVPVTPKDKIGSSRDMEERLEQLTDKALWDTSPETSVHIVPQYTRDRTPDTTASKGNLIIGGSISSNSASLNRNRLDTTMRDQIRDAHRDRIQIEETSFSPNSGRSDSNTYTADQTDVKSPYTSRQSGVNPLAMTMRAAIRDHRTDESTSPRSSNQATDSPDAGRILQRKSEEEEDEKIPPCWPRCVAVGVGLAILLAGIVALIVVFDERRKQEEECSNIKVNLTDTFRLHCMFAIDHDTRTGLRNSSYVRITKPDRSHEDETEFTFNEGNWSSILEVTVSCATVGNYSIEFENVSDDFQVKVTLESPAIITLLDQTFFNDTDESSEFRLDCSVSGDCTRYKLDIVGIRGNDEVELNENLTCMTSFSNTRGTSMNCTTTVPESIVSLYSEMRCRISNPQTATQYETFQYPRCGKNSDCPFINCTENSNDRNEIDQCKIYPTTISSCFEPGRKVHSFCNENSCSCKMNWCQSGRFPTTNELPGKVLCGELYEPITFTAGPTTEGTPKGPVG